MANDKYEYEHPYGPDNYYETINNKLKFGTTQPITWPKLNDLEEKKPSMKVWKAKFNEQVFPLSDLSFQKMLNRGFFEGYENSILINENGSVYPISDDGKLGHKKDLPLDNEYAKEEFTSNCDIYGNVVIDELNEIELVQKIDNKKLINFEKSLLLLYRPHMFKEMDNVSLVYNHMDQLLSCLLLQPDQFDEIFTINVGEPESPILKSYLNKLAEIISVEMESNEEIDESKLKDAEKDAYDFSGYRGKSLEVVKNEAKDYHNYFRFLLTRKEKIVVSTSELDYASKMVSIIKQDKNNVLNKVKDGSKINTKITGILGGVDSFYFEEVIPYIKKNTSIIVAKSIYYFDRNIKDFPSYVEEVNIDIKLALYHELISRSFEAKIRKGCKLVMSLLVCDKYYNYYDYSEIKFIGRYKKRLYSVFSKLDSAIVALESGSKFPVTFTDRIL